MKRESQDGSEGRFHGDSRAPDVIPGCIRVSMETEILRFVIAKIPAASLPWPKNRMPQILRCTWLVQATCWQVPAHCPIPAAEINWGHFAIQSNSTLTYFFNGGQSWLASRIYTVMQILYLLSADIRFWPPFCPFPLLVPPLVTPTNFQEGRSQTIIQKYWIEFCFF